jgi:FkbM family methyltransferase
MAWRTHPAVVVLRSIGRRTGINRLLCALSSAKPYEEDFDRALIQRVRGGDCAWDVGANRGIYLAKLLDAVGDSGCVVAFEPLPENAQLLRDAFGTRASVQLHQLALGSTDTEGLVVSGDDALRATTKVVPLARVELGSSGTAGAAGSTVRVRTADAIVAERAAPTPDVVKLDVEGAEFDCLIGMRTMLSSGRLRAIGIEVHYGLLAARGQQGAPREIEQLLSSFGYQVTWTDRSHLIADLRSP